MLLDNNFLCYFLKTNEQCCEVHYVTHQQGNYNPIFLIKKCDKEYSQTTKMLY